MNKIESRLTFSEHHEEIGRRNLEHKQICELILLVNKDEYEIEVFNEVKFAAVQVRVHSNKLIINAKFAIREVHVIFHVTKGQEERFHRFFGLQSTLALRTPRYNGQQLYPRKKQITDV